MGCASKQCYFFGKPLKKNDPRPFFCLETYTYGFNGQEIDSEMKGEGGAVNFKFRLHDPRLGRFFAVDALETSYPMLSTYQFAHNSPIQAIDLEGLQGYKMVDHQAKKTSIVVTFVHYEPSQTDSIGMSRPELDRMIKGIKREFAASSFVDNNNSDPSGDPYSVELVINVVEAPTQQDAYRMVSANAAPFGGGQGVANDMMVVEKMQKSSSSLGGGYVSSTPAHSSYGVLRTSDVSKTHSNTHELFHNLTHNHLNAPNDLKTQIDPNNQEPGHAAAGGIFVYPNEKTGVTSQPLNQQNIDDALRTLPGTEFNVEDISTEKLILGTEGYDN